MKKTFLFLTALVILLLFAGCSQAKEQYSKLMVQTMALDKLEDGSYQITMLAYKADGSQGMLSNGAEAGVMEHITCSGKSVYAAISNVSMITGLAPFYAHNNGIIFGEALAREGIDRVLDCFSQYTEIRPSVHVFVCEGMASDIVIRPGEGESDFARQIYLLAKSGEENGKIANATVKDIVSLEARQYSDVYIPVIARREVGETSELFVNGTAVFRDGTLSGYLNDVETRGLMLLLDKMRKGVAVIEQAEIGKVTYEFSYCKTKVSVDMRSGRPMIDITVGMRVELYESDRESEFKYGTDALATAEGCAEDYMRACIVQAVSKGLGACKSDVFGLGQRLYLKFPKQFPPVETDWRDVLQEAEYTIHVDADVRETGTTVNLR